MVNDYQLPKETKTKMIPAKNIKAGMKMVLWSPTISKTINFCNIEHVKYSPKTVKFTTERHGVRYSRRWQNDEEIEVVVE